MKNKKFDIKTYKYLIKIIKKSKRQTISFPQYFLGRVGIILRHDIDFCPSKALEIAKLETANSIFSTFFVMLNSKIYSMKNNRNRKIIKSIISLGHKVGLHFDPSIYKKNDNFSLNKFCKNECEILENLINRKIDIISFHRPEKKLIGLKKKIAGRNHAYMPELIEKVKYCSDSGGEWKFEDPEKIINNKYVRNIQLLTHPIWWTTPSNLSPGEKIAFFLKGSNKKRKEEAARNCKPYKKYLIENKFEEI